MPIPEFLIRPAQVSDSAAMAEIYNDYVRNTTISFETEAISAQQMQQRLEQNPHLPWLLACDGQGNILGYAYASPWKPRQAYRYSVETSVYLARTAHGRGLGSLLYTHLLQELKAIGMHSAIAGIAQPNPASVALHEKMGFRRVASFAEVGFKFGTWIDVGYWQKML